MDKSVNYLSNTVIEILRDRPRGKVLDLGCGDGESSRKLSDAGFQVTASDMDRARFKHHGTLDFKESDLNRPLPFSEGQFDYVIFLEVIEHIYNPDFVINEISRVLKPSGVLILSTPNIMNLGSRFRFLFEGSFDFFREPILDYSQMFSDSLQNMHVVVWRYHELEYLLYKHNLHVKKVRTDHHKPGLKVLAAVMRPLLMAQMKLKEARTRRKGGVRYERMNQIVLSDDLLLGRHLILEAAKNTNPEKILAGEPAAAHQRL